MKVVKTLVLTLILACGVHAGDMPQWDPDAPPSPPPPASDNSANDVFTKLLVAVMQNLLLMR